jgi:hypothetical protein
MNPKFKFCYISWAITFNSWIHNDVLLAFVLDSLTKPFEVLQLSNSCSSNFCFLCNSSNLVLEIKAQEDGTCNRPNLDYHLPSPSYVLLVICNVKNSSI